MIRRIYIAMIGSLILLLGACNQEEKAVVIDYSKLQYDSTHIKIFYHDTANHGFPAGSKPAPLYQDDLKVTDSLFKICITQFNNEQAALLKTIYEKVATAYQRPEYYLIDPAIYKKQYFPFTNASGGREIYINCFCDEQPVWQSKKVEVTGGGKCYFQLAVNLTARKYSNFHVNPVTDMPGSK